MDGNPQTLDLTSATLVLDIHNANGDHFHMEIPPGDKTQTMNRSNASDPTGDTICTIVLDINPHGDQRSTQDLIDKLRSAKK